MVVAAAERGWGGWVGRRRAWCGAFGVFGVRRCV